MTNRIITALKAGGGRYAESVAATGSASPAALSGMAIRKAKQVNSTTAPTPTRDPTIALGISRLGSPTSSARVLALSKPRNDHPANMTATTKGVAMNAVSDGQLIPLPSVATLLTLWKNSSQTAMPTEPVTSATRH